MRNGFEMLTAKIVERDTVKAGDIIYYIDGAYTKEKIMQVARVVSNRNGAMKIVELWNSKGFILNTQEIHLKGWSLILHNFGKPEKGFTNFEDFKNDNAEYFV